MRHDDAMSHNAAFCGAQHTREKNVHRLTAGSLSQANNGQRRHAMDNYLRLKRLSGPWCEMRNFPRMRKPAMETLTETGRSRISRANCPR